MQRLCGRPGLQHSDVLIELPPPASDDPPAARSHPVLGNFTKPLDLFPASALGLHSLVKLAAATGAKGLPYLGIQVVGSGMLSGTSGRPAVAAPLRRAPKLDDLGTRPLRTDRPEAEKARIRRDHHPAPRKRPVRTQQGQDPLEGGELCADFRPEYTAAFSKLPAELVARIEDRQALPDHQPGEGAVAHQALQGGATQLLSRQGPLETAL